MATLVFGPLGTEVHLEGRRYEIVELRDGGVTVWRSKCEACAAPFFVEQASGYLPTGKRCPEHKGQRLGLEPPPEASYEEKIAIQSRFPTGQIPVEQMLPSGAVATIRPVTPLGQQFFEEFPVLPPDDPRRVAIEQTLQPPRRGPGRPRKMPPQSETRADIRAGDEQDTTVAVTVGDEALAERIDGSAFDAELREELAEFEQEEEQAIFQEPDPEQTRLERLRLFVSNRMWLPSWGHTPSQEELASVFGGRRR